MTSNPSRLLLAPVLATLITLLPDVSGAEFQPMTPKIRLPAFPTVPQGITDRIRERHRKVYTEKVYTERNGGIFRISQRTSGSNSSPWWQYCILKRTHDPRYGADIGLESGFLTTGFAGANYGFFLDVSDLRFSEVVKAGPRPPAKLPSEMHEAWEFLWSYRPPIDEQEARRDKRQFGQGIFVGGEFIDGEIPAGEGKTFLMRSIRFRSGDFLLAGRVEYMLGDRSAVVVWRILKPFQVPMLRRAEDFR